VKERDSGREGEIARKRERERERKRERDRAYMYCTSCGFQIFCNRNEILNFNWTPIVLQLNSPGHHLIKI